MLLDGKVGRFFCNEKDSTVSDDRRALCNSTVADFLCHLSWWTGQMRNSGGFSKEPARKQSKQIINKINVNQNINI